MTVVQGTIPVKQDQSHARATEVQRLIFKAASTYLLTCQAIVLELSEGATESRGVTDMAAAPEPVIVSTYRRSTGRIAGGLVAKAAPMALNTNPWQALDDSYNSMARGLVAGPCNSQGFIGVRGAILPGPSWASLSTVQLVRGSSR